jgi:hypothetical protein
MPVESYDAEKEKAWHAFQHHDCMQAPDCAICRDFGEKCLRTGYTEGKVTPWSWPDTTLAGRKP